MNIRGTSDVAPLYSQLTLEMCCLQAVRDVLYIRFVCSADIHPRLLLMRDGHLVGAPMPVYHFTFHAYRSWMPDRPEGYVRRHEGLLPSEPEMARRYERQSRCTEISFSDGDAAALISAAEAICTERDWLLYEMAVTSSHVHLLVGWRSEERVDTVSNTLKRRLGAALSKRADRPGPWFSRGGSRRPVRNESHFEYLLREYLPSHGELRLSVVRAKRGDVESRS
jgi:REP element-mobilizing transposase RayT